MVAAYGVHNSAIQQYRQLKVCDENHTLPRYSEGSTFDRCEGSKRCLLRNTGKTKIAASYRMQSKPYKKSYNSREFFCVSCTSRHIKRTETWPTQPETHGKSLGRDNRSAIPPEQQRAQEDSENEFPFQWHLLWTLVMSYDALGKFNKNGNAGQISW